MCIKPYKFFCLCLRLLFFFFLLSMSLKVTFLEHTLSTFGDWIWHYTRSSENTPSKLWLKETMLSEQRDGEPKGRSFLSVTPLDIWVKALCTNLLGACLDCQRRKAKGKRQLLNRINMAHEGVDLLKAFAVLQVRMRWEYMEVMWRAVFSSVRLLLVCELKSPFWFKDRTLETHNYGEKEYGVSVLSGGP